RRHVHRIRGMYILRDRGKTTAPAICGLVVFWARPLQPGAANLIVVIVAVVNVVVVMNSKGHLVPGMVWPWCRASKERPHFLPQLLMLVQDVDSVVLVIPSARSQLLVP